MAYALLDANSNVTALYTGVPVPDPGVVPIADDDPRIAAFQAAREAALKPKPSPREWLERLAPTTQAAITKAAASDTTGAMLLWLLKAAGNPTIDVTNPETQQGVATLVATGIITQADQATLLAP